MGVLRESQAGCSQGNSQAGHHAFPVSQGVCVLPDVGRAWEIGNTSSHHLGLHHPPPRTGQPVADF